MAKCKALTGSVVKVVNCVTISNNVRRIKSIKIVTVLASALRSLVGADLAYTTVTNFVERNQRANLGRSKRVGQRGLI